MKKAKRVFVIVLDSVGIGALPDAADFGDEGANTLRRISASDKFNIPNLISLGIGSIEGVDYLPSPKPLAKVMRLREISRGKDTTVGHWELMGIVSKTPMPTYPDGFPEDLIAEFVNKCSLPGVLANKPYSGTVVIDKFGEEHMRTGKPIVYTSADSVFQIAAHEDVIPPERLYELCRAARELLVGEHGVGRVIARPFVGEPGSFKRTDRRRDFSLMPPEPTVLDKLSDAGYDVIGVGKISDIFGGRGVTESIPTHGNTEGIKTTLLLMERDFNGFCFINLVDFDMLYGHRQDVDGYAAALSELDAAIPAMLERLGEDDVLIITADHGCDPGDDSTDHTREYIPVITYRKGEEGASLGTADGFYTVGRAVMELLGACEG
ncbi:MAG: phosphopentomutase [Clostridia bacterium]|nr:phosphopentomutase [Clostridia bacterium]